MKQVIENINQLNKVFQNSMTYPSSMVWRQVIDLNMHQWDDIGSAIEKTVMFIDTYSYEFGSGVQDYGEFRQYIEIYAVACLPFLIFAFLKHEFKHPTFHFLPGFCNSTLFSK